MNRTSNDATRGTSTTVPTGPRSSLVPNSVRDVKICLIGDTTVGKSSLLQRFITQQFIEQDITIGAAFSSKIVAVEGVSLRLNIWDTAGQERFKSLVAMYCRGAAAAIVVFDLTKRGTSESVSEWVEMLARHCELDSVLLAIVGNKSDLDDRKITPQQGEELAARFGSRAFYMETSAKSGTNVVEVFEEIAKRIAHQLNDSSRGASAAAGGNTLRVGAPAAQTRTRSGCRC